MKTEHTPITGYTPGPWKVYGQTFILTEDKVPIAHVDTATDKTTWPERAANARLIASAPDMAATIERLEKENESMRFQLKQFHKM